jgi:gliding motility-associated-like protein
MMIVASCHRYALAIILFLCCGTADAQLTANFTASPVSGCSPVIVNFTDQSTGSPTQWRWDLGNGVISTLRNPSATYFTPGTYTVKLTIHNATGADSIVKTNLITVYANPVVAFSASDTTGCFPLPVHFTDQSTAGSGSIASWQWDFGDGNLSPAANPSHTYTAAGNFTVTLKVTNASGCVKTLSKDQYIRITNGVRADFTQTTPGPCAAPATVQFTNTSAGPGNMSYVWNFGDGFSSTDADPLHTYTTNGSYTVMLVAVSAQGCRDTIIKENAVNVGTSHTDFNAPDTVCVNSTVTFDNTSTVTPISLLWDFGNGTTSTATNPSKVYTVPGIYTVKLVNNFGACSDSASKVLVVSARPQASFDADTRSFCKAPALVQFHSTAQAGQSLSWNFGDGATSTQINPAHTYTAEGSYTVNLIVTNASGCSDTLSQPAFISVQKPQVTFSQLPRTGCIPLTINPSTIITSTEPIQTYSWDFGDGATSTSPTPVHTYTVPGTYTVKLIVTTASGCTDTVVLSSAVRAGTKPHAAFTNQPTDICAMMPAQFTDLSTGNVDQWVWDFGDGSMSTTQNPLHNYSDTGWFNVTLVAMNNTCPDTVIIQHAVHVRPPIPGFNVRFDCATPFDREFVDHSIGATSWQWDFGDGATSTSQNTSHTYAATGTYTVTQTVTNGTCTNSTTATVKVVNEKANFTASDTAICKNVNVDFRPVGINNANIDSWHWTFGDGGEASTAGFASHTYRASGIYTVTLTIEDILHCTSTYSMQVRVYGPTAAFTASAPVSCLDNNITYFNNTSTTDGIHPITTYIWNFGDGVIDSVSTSNFQHHYQDAGVYGITLTVRDDRGCTDQLSRPASVTIAQPVAAFYSPDTMSCTDKNINFINNSTGTGLSYTWHFGDGQQASDAAPVHHYGQVGIFDVQLAVTDQYGCHDSLSRPQYIHISLPKAAFAVSDSFGTCPPLIVHFTDQSMNYASIQWYFGDGTTSSLVNPSHFYNTPGTYYATVVVTGPGGCTDTARQKIVVKGPNGSFSYTPLTGCKPLTVSFKANTLNTASFVWDFSDGNTLATQDSIVTHTYITPGDFIPKMILVDAGGCNVPITGIDTIRVYGVTAGFSLDANRFCTSGTVHFTNSTVSNDYITGYQWSFGDGSFSSDVNPVHSYGNIGTYTVQLVPITQNGCTDTAALRDTVQILQRPSVSIGGDTAACIPGLLRIKGIINNSAGSTLSWQWNFGDGQLSNVQDPPVHLYPSAGSYTVTAIATAQNGCMDTATRPVQLYPLPTTNAGPDQWICRGSVAHLQASGADTYKWNDQPSLSCDLCPAPLAAPTDSTTYIVTGTNTFGCSTRDSVTVRVHQPFRLLVDPGDTICIGQPAHLSAHGADHYSWSPAASLETPDAANTVAHPQVSTTYKVTATDNSNCFTDTGSVFIKVWPIPVITMGPGQTLVVGNAIQLQPTYSSDVSSWLWNNAGSLSCNTCPAPTAKPKQTTQYTVQAKNDGGCTAQANITISVICNNGNLFIPNTFSPNGDGANDQFYPSGSGIHMIKTLRIFNRWGEVVFERVNFAANDASAGWNGTYKGQLQAADVYVYTCDVVCENNEVLTFKGDVTLLR